MLKISKMKTTISCLKGDITFFVIFFAFFLQFHQWMTFETHQWLKHFVSMYFTRTT